MQRPPALGLHAPGHRVTISRFGDWEVKRHDETQLEHQYFAPRGLLHLQLWHAEHRISILTPSRLTSRHFEIWRDGIRTSFAHWDGVRAHLPDLGLPTGLELAALFTWTVVRDEAAAQTRTAVAM